MSKNHKDIESAERHNPKGFESASNSTVLSKDESGNLIWVTKDDVGGSQGPTGPQGPASSLENVLTVQTDPQVGQYASISAALAAITDASESNPYYINVGPGEYSVSATINMKPWVIVRGTGKATRLIFNFSGAHGIRGADFAAIENCFVGFPDMTNTGYAAIYHENLTSGAGSRNFIVKNVHMGWSDIGIMSKATSYATQINVFDFSYGSTYSCNYLFKLEGPGSATARIISESLRPIAVATPRPFALIHASGNVEFVGSSFLANSGGNALSGHTYGAGTLGKYGIYAENGATVRMIGGTLRGWETAIYTANVGTGPQIDIQGLYTDRNINSINIAHPDTSGAIFIQAEGSKITVDPAVSNLTMLVSDIEEGAQGIINLGKMKIAPGGVLSEAFDMGYIAKYSSTAGCYDGGMISINSGLTIDVEAGRGYLYDSGTDIKEEVVWTAKTAHAVPANGDYYILVDKDGNLVNSASVAKTENVILLGRVVTAASTIRFIENLPAQGFHSVNKLFDFHRNTFGCVYESGSTVAENGSVAHNLDVGSGVRWYMGNEINTSGGAQITFTQLYRNGSGGWTETTLQTVNNTQYDDGDGTLASLTATYYSCRYLYIVGANDDGSEKYYLQLGQEEHATQNAAEAETTPVPPSWLKDGAVPIAQIVVQQGAANIVSVTSLKPSLGGSVAGGGGGGASDHGNLTGLADDDHPQYVLTDGSRTLTGALNMGTHDITNVGNVDGVDVSAHASRHLPNGADPLSTAAGVSINNTNAVGTANTLARADHTHKVVISTLSGGEFTMQQMHDVMHSTGISQRTDFVITDNGDGTIDIGSGVAFVRSSNSGTATLYHVSFAGQAGIALTDTSNNYIYLDYNAGSPAISISLTKSTDYHSKVHLGKIYRTGTELHIAQFERQVIGDHSSIMSQAMQQAMPYMRNEDGTGGGILTETDTRKVAVSEFNGWHGLQAVTITAIDTNTAGSFDYYYNRASWQRTTGNTQFSNSQWDNAGTLTALTAGYYRCDWVYRETDNELMLIYGNAEHATLADARAELKPASLPAPLQGHSVLVGKIITQQGGTNATEVLSAWTDDLEQTTAADHGALSGLADDDHTQYLLVSGSRAMTGSLNMGGNSITNVGVVPLTNSSVTATVDTSTNSATDVTMASMTVTPAAGTYFVSFSASGGTSANGANAVYAIYNNGTIVQHSQRNLNFNGGAAFTGADTGMHTQAVVTVTGVEAIDVRYSVDSGNFDVHERSLTVIRVG